jgi:hypothetical protein
VACVRMGAAEGIPAGSNLSPSVDLWQHTRFTRRVDELRERLWAAVEHHPSRLTPEGERRLQALVAEGAERLASEPDRIDEAVANLQLVLDRAAEDASEREEGRPERDEGGAGTLAVGATISGDNVDLALRFLCPLFPIC